VAINFDERTSNPNEKVEQVELFTLEGKTYTIPKTLDGGRVLGFMQEVRNVGTEAASVGLLIDLIGQSAYRKLREYPGLTLADLKAIFKVVEQSATGAMEEVAGN
jgi:hypothetical protein